MQDFTNNMLDVDSFPKYEELPLSRLSKKYWFVLLMNIVIFLLVLFCGLTSIVYFFEGWRPFIYILYAGYLAFSVLLIFLYKMDVDRRGFAVREKDILYRSGIIAITTTLIPFSRIQHISLEEGLFSRLFHLGQLSIFTAGGSSGSLHIPGIEIEQARQIKELLMKQIHEEH